MCGIAGILSGENGQIPDEAILRSMADSLVHRGPDDSGVWMDGASGIGLCHRRLAIIDLSPQGHQPMLSASERYVAVYNGEIYNFQTLRNDLKKEGIGFRGGSDTEVLLAAIEFWGVAEAISKCAGMFAIALWDRKERKLHLIRDRLGEKPLYYSWIGDTFVFGSELKALMQYPGCLQKIDRGALLLFARHGYVPTPYCIFENFYKLPPGSILEVAPGGKPAVFSPFGVSNHSEKSEAPVYYWHGFSIAGKPRNHALSEKTAINELETLLLEVVGQQMVADVPLGAFLSGGVDSSTIVALMQSQSSVPIHTFTIGFHEQGYNEAGYAKEIAGYLGTYHTEMYVTPDEIRNVIPHIPQLYDEPFADSSQLPTHLIAALTRRHVTVSLSGDGGDELFAGYNRYFWGRSLWQRLRAKPRFMRKGMALLMTGLSPSTWDSLSFAFRKWMPEELKAGRAGDKLHKLALVLDVETPQEMYNRLVSVIQQAELVVRHPSFPPTLLTERDMWPDVENFTEWMMALDMMTYLPDDILVKNDRAAMGVSLETRMPFLDHRIVEYAWSLPLAMKIKGNQGKWILHQLLKKYLPEHYFTRPKMGFAVPISDWLKGPLKGWAEALIDRERLEREGYFQADVVHEKWKEHLEGKRNWQYFLWNILMFQAWKEEWNID